MQIRKMLAAFVSVVMMCSVVSVPAFAVDETQIVTDLVSPAYEYATKTENYLTITSSTADCKSLCNGMAGVTQITVEHTLEKHWGLWIWNEGWKCGSSDGFAYPRVDFWYCLYLIGSTYHGGWIWKYGDGYKCCVL